jgi:Ca2+-binding EF-hand superfamily protein
MRRFLPYVFTEHGVLMLSSVLKSQRAVDINIMIMRAFVQMRQFMLRQVSKRDEVKELKRMLLLYIDNTDGRLDAQDSRINEIIRVLNNLIEHPKPAKRIGFSNQ